MQKCVEELKKMISWSNKVDAVTTFIKDMVEIPSHAEVCTNNDDFKDRFRLWYNECGWRKNISSV